MILYGAPVKERIKEELIKRIRARRAKPFGRRPVLVIVQVGDREDSNIYIKKKKEFGEEVGVVIRLERWPHFAKATRGEKDENPPAGEAEMKGLEEKIIQKIDKLNKDKNVDGIIVQLPLPKKLNTRKILNEIDKKKDADGLREIKSREKNILITPATAKAVMRLLDFYKISIKGKKTVVIGQSILAGKPIADELDHKGAQVKRCDSKTRNIPGIAKKADVLISSVGKANLVTTEFVNKNQVVIDVGINRVDGKLVGDVAFKEVEPLVRAISPVPGGIGPLTVACLFENLLDLCYSDRNS